LKDGYQVRALVRTPSKLGIEHPNLTVVPGDLSEAEKVEETIRGSDAVALLVGFSPSVKTPADMRAAAARNVIAAMHKLTVKRLVRLTSFLGSKDPSDQLGLPMKLWARFTNKNVLADEQKAVDLVAGSDLDWTIVRNAMITGGAPKGSPKGSHVGGGKTSIPAADLAAFILDELGSRQHLHQTPFVHP
jgi:uncharacterized protein YbjT (DUF2867 family)